MTLHEIAIAMEDKGSAFYTDNDGNTVEAYIESITDDGNIIIVTWHGNRKKKKKKTEKKKKKKRKKA